MIDRDLAELYGVETKHLNRQVKRNIQCFPEEFMFHLTPAKKTELVTICHQFRTMKDLYKQVKPTRTLKRVSTNPIQW
jgi:hypothetical protein